MSTAASSPSPPPPPGTLTLTDLLDRSFLQHRANLLDLAAFLDRCARAPAPGSQSDDARLIALRGVMPILTDGRPDRARRILEHLSDPTTDPLERSDGRPAAGAPTPNS
jgi:hypothetical protein